MDKLLQHLIIECLVETRSSTVGSTLKQRKEMVNAFKANRSNKIFIFSLKLSAPVSTLLPPTQDSEHQSLVFMKLYIFGQVSE